MNFALPDQHTLTFVCKYTIRLSATHLQIAPVAFLAIIPLAKVAQIHFSLLFRFNMPAASRLRD